MGWCGSTERARTRRFMLLLLGLSAIAAVPAAASTGTAILVGGRASPDTAHACLVTAAGGVACWGKNDYGQLGDGSNVDRSVPAPVSGLESGIVSVAAGGAHSCALDTSGGVRCWGSNSGGQLGNGSPSQ